MLETRRTVQAQVESTGLDQHSLIGLHAHSGTQPMRARTPCILSLSLYSNVSLLYEGAIGQPKQTTSLCVTCIQGKTPLNSYVILKHKKLALVTGTQLHTHPDIPTITIS